MEHTQRYMKAVSDTFKGVADSDEHREILIRAKQITDSVRKDESEVVVFGAMFVAMESMLEGYKKAAMESALEAS